MSDPYECDTERLNPNTLFVFLGVDMLYFENTESMLWLETVDFMTPKSPVADELRDRCVNTDTDRSKNHTNE